ncbi:MAG TPA: amidase [Steroidobacteraceae bacterium]|jgi:amidase
MSGSQPDAPANAERRAFLGLAATLGLTGMVSGKPPSAPRALPEICALDAVSLSAAIHAKRLSCVEVMGAYLDHIGRINPKVNAIVALQERELLLRQAREHDELLSRGNSKGVLHGFPHAVKDLQPVKGIVSTQGSPLFKDFVPSAEGLMVERLRGAGAVFIGKTNTPEFGLGSNTYNSVYGATRNAYDLSRSAGGSSGGAAVGLAVRMLPVADGSDYGGSLRNPAGWNNVYGFRTSFGCVPNDAKDEWLPSMGVLGPMARNVQDLAMLLSVQAGYDDRAPLSVLQEGSRFNERLERDFKGTRIAWCRDFKGTVPHDPEVLATCEAALKTFESLGCIVEEASPEFSVPAVWDALVKLRGWQMGGGLHEFYEDPRKRALLKPEAVFEIETGLKLSAYEISHASSVRTLFTHATRKLLSRYDYLIVPTAQVFPFSVEEHWPETVAGMRMNTYHEWMKGTFLVTMAGMPALAAPAGFSAQGLPIGLQIVANHHQELKCLQLARAYERASRHNERLSPLLS